MAARVMDGVLGAAGAPRASRLHQFKALRAPGHFDETSFTPPPICRIVRHLRLHQLGESKASKGEKMNAGIPDVCAVGLGARFT